MLDSALLTRVLSARKRMLLSQCRLILVVEHTASLGPSESEQTATALDKIAACLDAGIKTILLSEQTEPVTSRKLLAFARKLRALTAQYDASLLIHRRIDLALAVDAEGVHLDQQDMDSVTVREILGNDRLVGLWVHTAQEAQEAADQPVDYLFAGPVYATDVLPGQLKLRQQLLGWLANNAQQPWFASGGVDAAVLPELTQLGVERVAVSRCLMKSKTPGEAARQLMAKLETAHCQPPLASVGG